MVVPLTAHDDACAACAPGRTARLVAVSWRHWFREVAVIAAGALAALAAQAFSSDSGRLHTEARHFPFARLRGNADVAAMLFTL